MQNVVRAQRLTGERALFMSRELKIYDTIFDDGESPLKESRDIELVNCMFKWKYPLWYCRNVKVTDCQWFEMARAGVWYTDNMEVDRAVIEAPKNFRRCRELTLRDVDMPNAQETLWHCSGVKLDNVSAKGDYFAMNKKKVALTPAGKVFLDEATGISGFRCLFSFHAVKKSITLRYICAPPVITFLHRIRYSCKNQSLFF